MHSEIYRLAHQLSREGKTPSVALIRSRLSKPTSLPDIIQALQQWKLTPELGKEGTTRHLDADHQDSATGREFDNGQIVQRLNRLEDKIDHIIGLLNQAR